jgi:hypothetical protein
VYQNGHANADEAVRRHYGSDTGQPSCIRSTAQLLRLAQAILRLPQQPRISFAKKDVAASNQNQAFHAFSTHRASGINKMRGRPKGQPRSVPLFSLGD